MVDTNVEDTSRPIVIPSTTPTSMDPETTRGDTLVLDQQLFLWVPHPAAISNWEY